MVDIQEGRSAAFERGRPQGGQAQRRGGLKLTIPIVIALAVAIFAVGIYMRGGMLQYQGFFEPDGFFHYSVIQQTIANGFAVPMTSQYSGFPVHNGITEPLGLYYVTIIPYSFLQYFGITAYDIQRLMPLVFAMGEMVAAYFIVQHLSKSRSLGLLAMLLLALSGGDAARTSALVYRGDSFITLFMLLSLLFMMKAIEAKEGRRKYAYMLLSPIMLGIGTAVWNGSPYSVVVYVMAVLLLEVYAFVKGDGRRVRDATLLGVALAVEYAMGSLFAASGVVRVDQGLSGPHFLIFYLPIVLGGALFYLVLRRRNVLGADLGTAGRRGAFTAVLAIAAAGVTIALFYGYLAGIATGNGLVVAGNPFTQSIQELQTPTLQYLWASFSLEIILAPIGVAGFLLLYARRRVDDAIGEGAACAFLVLLAYLIVTSYLQANAVRYNALVAAPIAMFAAVALYAPGRGLLGARARRPSGAYAYAVAVAAVLLASAVLASGSAASMLQGDGINPAFLNATVWIRNNTPRNATFLTLWPDGSVIEGWGQRQSLMDSVAGMGNLGIIENFSAFLLNSSYDTTYLRTVHPDYVLVRELWLWEAGGIAKDGGISNAGAYNVTPLLPLRPESDAATETVTYRFASQRANASMTVGSGTAQESLEARASVGGTQVEIGRVVFYDYGQDAYSSANTSAASSWTLLVTYSENGSTLSVGSADLIPPAVTRSNLFRLVALCSPSACPYTGGGISLQAVYSNADTRVFRVLYNAT